MVARVEAAQQRLQQAVEIHPRGILQHSSEERIRTEIGQKMDGVMVALAELQGSNPPFPLQETFAQAENLPENEKAAIMMGAYAILHMFTTREGFDLSYTSGENSAEVQAEFALRTTERQRDYAWQELLLQRQEAELAKERVGKPSILRNKQFPNIIEITIPQGEALADYLMVEPAQTGGYQLDIDDRVDGHIRDWDLLLDNILPNFLVDGILREYNGSFKFIGDTGAERDRFIDLMRHTAYSTIATIGLVRNEVEFQQNQDAEQRSQIATEQAQRATIQQQEAQRARTIGLAQQAPYVDVLANLYATKGLKDSESLPTKFVPEFARILRAADWGERVRALVLHRPGREREGIMTQFARWAHAAPDTFDSPVLERVSASLDNVIGKLEDGCDLVVRVQINGQGLGQKQQVLSADIRPYSSTDTPDVKKTGLAFDATISSDNKEIGPKAQRVEELVMHLPAGLNKHFRLASFVGINAQPVLDINYNHTEHVTGPASHDAVLPPKSVAAPEKVLLDGLAFYLHKNISTAMGTMGKKEAVLGVTNFAKGLITELAFANTESIGDRASRALRRLSSN